MRGSGWIRLRTTFESCREFGVRLSRLVRKVRRSFLKCAAPFSPLCRLVNVSQVMKDVQEVQMSQRWTMDDKGNLET